MLIRKLALIPAALIALGLTVGVPAESFAQGSTKPAATKKAKKKAAKKAKKAKKAADAGALRTFA